jgi:hypothetical protein
MAVAVGLSGTVPARRLRVGGLGAGRVGGRLVEAEGRMNQRQRNGFVAATAALVALALVAAATERAIRKW